MSPPNLLPFVQASAALLGLLVDEARAQRVAEHLARTATLAELLDAVPLTPADELAEIYCPAAFLFQAPGS
jgi:Protein of unknown function (DUF4089)